MTTAAHEALKCEHNTLVSQQYVLPRVGQTTPEWGFCLQVAKSTFEAKRKALKRIQELRATVLCNVDTYAKIDAEVAKQFRIIKRCNGKIERRGWAIFDAATAEHYVRIGCMFFS